MRKKLLQIPLLAVLTAAMLCSGAMAAKIEIDMGYSGPLDTFTGGPAASSGGSEEPEQVWISDEIRYDAGERMFVYVLEDSLYNEVWASVMDGMITGDAVSVRPDDGVQISLFYNGEYLADPSWAELTEPGEYVVMQGNGNQAGDRLFSFTIIGEKTNSLKNYAMPDGFQILEATLNGETVYYERNFVDLSAEGEYYIKYRCIRNDAVYELSYTADFTVPVLALEAVEDGVARGPVDLSDLEPGAAIGVWLDESPISPEQTLTRSGSYVVKVADEAGNMNTYSFAIRLYFDSNSLIFFALILSVVIGTAAYVVMSRKRLRVR